MTSSIESIRQAIVQKVGQLRSVHSTFNYETGTPDGYPFATITPARGTSEFGDSAGSHSGRNIVTTEFIVRVYQEREEGLFGAQKAENISVTVLDELLTAFHQDTTLSGTVLWQRPTEWEKDADLSDKIVNVVSVTIQAVSEIDSK